jgi:hypothetical protein
VSDLQSIHIDSGVKRIAINDDPERVIEFNPHDTKFAEKLYKAYGDLARLEKEYSKRAEEIGANVEADELNVPKDFGPFIEIQDEMLADILEQIDFLFGAGASERIFQGDVTTYTVKQFLEGVQQYIIPERAEVIEKYLPPKQENGKKEPSSSIPPELVLPLVDEYRAGATIPKLARKYQIKESAIKAAFERLKALHE